MICEYLWERRGESLFANISHYFLSNNDWGSHYLEESIFDATTGLRLQCCNPSADVNIITRSSAYITQLIGV